VKPGQKLRTRSCLSLVTLGVMLLGCNTSATSPSEGVPTRSLGPAAATDLPLDKPPPTRHTNSVVPHEANSIYFAGRATRIDPAGQGKLRLHAARLKENPEQVVSLAFNGRQGPRGMVAHDLCGGWRLVDNGERARRDWARRLP